MKVRSPLADMDVIVGQVRRAGDDLVLTSGPGSSIEAIITVSAREVVSTLVKVLASPAGLLFIIGLPWLWLKQTFGPSMPAAAASRTPPSTDINKPW